jgi:hypothetical protein
MIRSAHLAAAALLCAAAGCATFGTSGSFPPDDTARPATELPEAFTPPAGGGDAGVCRSPLTDPRTGAELRFVRTQGERGDYEVPVGRYGAREGELLRIDCRTWRAVGLVRR